MSTQKTADEIKEVSVFCLEHQGKCFKEWPASKIFRFIAFHLLNDTLFVTRNIEGHITGVAIAWLAKASEIIRRDERGIPQFAWGLPPKGNALLISDVCGSREVCGQLWKQAIEKWPKIDRVFAYRQKGEKPELVEFTVETLKRFYAT